MLEKVIGIITIIIVLRIVYAIAAKLFLKGMKLTQFIKWVIGKFNNKKGVN